MGKINLFRIVAIVVVVGAIIVGGWVIWKSIHSSAKVASDSTEAEKLLERTVAARQEENKIQDAPSGKKSSLELLENYIGKAYDNGYTQEDVTDENQLEDESAVQDEASEANQQFSYTLEETSTPKKTTSSVAQSKRAVASKTQPKIKYASYARGLTECLQNHRFPCVWKNNSGTLIKQYVLKNGQGPVERIVFSSEGKIISQTFATLDGQVTRYQGSFADLYFEGGLLTKIRTFPYDNPNLRDWFLIGPNGKITACLCGMPTKDCCSRCLLYREGGPRSYCALFPVDTDFCAKSHA